jgi:hypothetical protein
MAITLKRQLTDEDKGIILGRFGRMCFATGHGIPQGEPLHFDHIRAFARGGESEVDNIAPMCEHHNKAKGTLPLEDFRTKLRLQEFFQTGDRLTLKNLLNHLQGKGEIERFGDLVVIGVTTDRVTVESNSTKIESKLYTCATTGWNYFYATIPVSILNSDDDEDHKLGLQPRFLIFDKVFELFRHFQMHPVLQPSIGRIDKERIVLFDGQHKVAALLWNGRRDFDCKVYLDPELRILNQTNISAHDRFAQTRFFSSVMVLKLGSQFGADFEKYKNREDNETKSEGGFLQFLEREDPTMSRADRNKRFRSYLMNAVIEDETNKMSPFISGGNRSSQETPLTIDMLSKSLFACFLNTDPSWDNMATDAYRRDAEIANNVSLMNFLYELALHAWSKTPTPGNHLQTRLNRIFGSKSIMAWSEILKDAVCAKLELLDQEERQRPFYRDLSDEQLNGVKKVVERLVSWSGWSAPHPSDIDTNLAANKTALKDWFRKNLLTTGYLLGAPQ